MSRPACPARAGKEGWRGTSPEGVVRVVLTISPAVEGGAAGNVFRHAPQQSACDERLGAAGPLISQVIEALT